MDLSKLSELFQGNNLILILLALFLFKDQLLALIGIKPKVDPVPVPVPVPAPVPTPSPIIVPADHPLIDALIKLLPVVLPVILPLITKGAEQQAKELEPPK